MNYDAAKALVSRGRQVLSSITRLVEEAVCALADTGCTSEERNLIALALASSREKEEATEQELLSKWKKAYPALAEWWSRARAGQSLEAGEDKWVPVHARRALLVYVELWDGRHWLYCPQADWIEHARVAADHLLQDNRYALPEGTVFVDDASVVEEEIRAGSQDGRLLRCDVVARLLIELHQLGREVYRSEPKKCYRPTRKAIAKEVVSVQPMSASLVGKADASGCDKVRVIRTDHGDCLVFEGRPRQGRRLGAEAGTFEAIGFIERHVWSRYRRSLLVCRRAGGSKDMRDVLYQFTLLPDDGLCFVISEFDLRHRFRRDIQQVVDLYMTGRYGDGT